MTIKIEFPAERTDIALALGQALTAIGHGKAPSQATATRHVHDEAQHQAAPVHIEYGDPGAFAELDHEYVDTNTGEITQTSGPSSVEGDAGKSASNAAETGSLVGAKSSAPAGANTRLDEKGVPYNAEFCANAAKPFYGTGKLAGQWKKRQGVDQGEYNEWYESALAVVTSDTHEEDQAADAAEETRDYAAEQRAACAFGAQTTETAAHGAPANMGELMAWISERQAAGTMPPDAVASAFTTLGLPMDALLNPAGDIPGNCAKVWAALGGGK